MIVGPAGYNHAPQQKEQPMRSSPWNSMTKRQINARFRQSDTSHLWPISGRFNVTERAIRKVRKWQRDSGVFLEGVEYAYFLEREISDIVNKAV